MKRFILLGTLITLVLFTTAVFAGNPSKAAKADAKKDTLITEPAEAEQAIEKKKGMKSQPEDIVKEKKGKEAEGKSKPEEADDKKVDKENDNKDKDVSRKPDQDKPKKETVVGSVISINNMTGVIVVKEENKKTERTIVVNQDDLKSLSAGDKVNIELAPGLNTAEKVSIIAEGKGGSKGKKKQ